MGYLLGCAACGISAVMAVNGMVDKIKRADDEISLPPAIRPREYLMLFLCGALSYQGISINTLIALGLAVYMGFMAYIDYNTMKVYSAFSYLVIVIGTIYLFQKADDWKVELVNLSVYFMLIMIGCIVRAYSFGDAEILMALYPYYAMMFFDGWEAVDRLILCVVCFLAAIFLTVITSIKPHPLRIQKLKPAAPDIACAYAVAMCVSYFFKR